jgi:hypothetical protein
MSHLQKRQVICGSMATSAALPAIRTGNPFPNHQKWTFPRDLLVVFAVRPPIMGRMGDFTVVFAG